MLSVTPTDLPDVLIVETAWHADARGAFSEVWNARRFAGAGIARNWVQDNQSVSARAGTVRGLHFQAPPHAQAKLVRVLAGAIRDVAVDIRAGSPGYGRWVAVELSAENRRQLFIPEGFAHGFVTLLPGTEVLYKCSAPYAPESEGALRYDDPDLAIDWGLPPGGALLSDKDAAAPGFAGFESPFAHG